MDEEKQSLLMHTERLLVPSIAEGKAEDEEDNDTGSFNKDTETKADTLNRTADNVTGK